MTRTVEEMMADLPPSAFSRNTKFVPKFTFADRCAILAFLSQGVSSYLLAEAYGANRRTIVHIGNESSPHYKDVRKEMARLGPKEFAVKYVTEEQYEKVRAAQSARETLAADKASSETDRLSMLKSYSSRKDAGNHTIQNAAMVRPHTIHISWSTEHKCWGYTDPDDKQFPNEFFYVGSNGEKFASSTAVLRHCEVELSDFGDPSDTKPD